MLKSTRLVATAAAATLLLATGCVSKEQFNHVTAERDRVILDLSQTREERNAANHTSDRLSTELAAAKAESERHAKETLAVAAHLKETEGQLAATQAELATAQGDLTTARACMAQAEGDRTLARNNLTAAERRIAQLRADIENARGDYSKLQAEAQARAEEAAAQLGDARTALSVAQKDQDELKVIRQKLSDANAAQADARKRLGDAERQLAEMTSKFDDANGQLSQLKDDARARAVEAAAARLAQAQLASAAVRKEQAELEATRQKLTDAENAANTARGRLVLSEKRVSDLEAKLRTLTTQANKPAQVGSETPATANIAN
jgi:chromosome segregation protein